MGKGLCLLRVRDFRREFGFWGPLWSAPALLMVVRLWPPDGVSALIRRGRDQRSVSATRGQREAAVTGRGLSGELAGWPPGLGLPACSLAHAGVFSSPWFVAFCHCGLQVADPDTDPSSAASSRNARGCAWPKAAAGARRKQRAAQVPRPGV